MTGPAALVDRFVALMEAGGWTLVSSESSGYTKSVRMSRYTPREQALENVRAIKRDLDKATTLPDFKRDLGQPTALPDWEDWSSDLTFTPRGYPATPEAPAPEPQPATTTKTNKE